jgi:hypothetical protein
VVTGLDVALSFGQMFVCDGTLGEGDTGVKEVKHALEIGVERG